MGAKVKWDRSDTEEVIKGVTVGVVVFLLSSIVEFVVNKYIKTTEDQKDTE